MSTITITSAATTISRLTGIDVDAITADLTVGCGFEVEGVEYIPTADLTSVTVSISEDAPF